MAAVVVAKSKFECDGKAVMFSPSGHVTGIASDDGVATVLVDGATAAGSDVCGALVIQAVEAATCEGSRALRVLERWRKRPIAQEDAS